MSIRSAAELANVNEPAWPEIERMVAGGNAVVLPIEPGRGLETLWSLQVTARSYLGAMALNCGGIVADHGWFRLYGSGTDLLPDLATKNGLGQPTEESAPPGALLVGEDVVGGRFAIDGGALGVKPGEVCYFGPDTLSWDGLGGGYSAFVSALLSGGLGEVFASLRWPGWESEIRDLRLDEGIMLWPPPSTEEGKDVSQTTRRPVPMSQLRHLYG